MDNERRVMYPRGRVIHYAKDENGFQKIKLFCGPVLNLWKMKETFEDWGGMTRYCHNCLLARFNKDE